MMEPSAQPEFARRIQGLRRSWAEHPELASLMMEKAREARDIPGCDAAGITMILEGRSQTLGATSQLTMELDLIQYETGEGPCLDSIALGEVIRVDLTDVGEGYPHFAPGALELVIRSVLSLPMHRGERTVGALNLYSRTVKAFGEDQVAAGERIAAAAADAGPPRSSS